MSEVKSGERMRNLDAKSALNTNRLAQRLEAVKNLQHIKVGDVNEKVAVKSTLIFGSIWMFYVFFLYGFIPLFPKFAPYRDVFLYWGSWIQLWALPLLMVGGIVLNRSTEKRAAEDHETLLAELAEIKAMHCDILQLIQLSKDQSKGSTE